MLDLDKLTIGIRPYVFLAFMVAVISLPGVFSMPVMDRDEARFTQATSQMLETDDYVVIRYHDGLRNKKPVGIHWLQAAAVSTFSDAHKREIWAYRIPSFLGAVLATWALFWGATASLPKRAAFLGSTLLGVCLLLSSEAHIAKTDAALVGFITLFMGALARMRAPIKQGDRKAALPRDISTPLVGTLGNFYALIFWIAMGWGVLIKGPVAPMVAGLTMAMLFAWERKIKWAMPLAFWPGPVLFLILTVPWFLAVQVATGGVFLNEAVGVDLGPKMVGGAEGHAAPPGTHITGLPALIWPTTLFLIPGLVYAVQQVTKPSKSKSIAVTLSYWRFAIAWLIPTWLVFEIMPTKLVHYTMPAYPPLALMAGAALDSLMGAGKRIKPPTWSLWTSFVLFVLVSLLLIAILSPWGIASLRAEAASDFGYRADRVAAIWAQDWKDVGAPIWPMLLGIVIISATTWTFIQKRWELTFLALIGCSLIVGGSLRGVVLPKQDWIIATNAAMSALREVCGFPEGAARSKAIECAETPPPQLVRAITFAEPSFLYSLNGRASLPPDTTPDVPPLSSGDTRPVWLINIMKEEGRRALRSIVHQADEADRCVRLSRRFVKNYSNNDPSELVAVVVEPERCNKNRFLDSPKNLDETIDTPAP